MRAQKNLEERNGHSVAGAPIMSGDVGFPAKTAAVSAVQRLAKEDYGQQCAFAGTTKQLTNSFTRSVAGGDAILSGGIAATALAYRLVVVTRNIKDFPDVETLDPWGDSAT